MALEIWDRLTDTGEGINRIAKHNFFAALEHVTSGVTGSITAQNAIDHWSLTAEDQSVLNSIINKINASDYTAEYVHASVLLVEEGILDLNGLKTALGLGA